MTADADNWRTEPVMVRRRRIARCEALALRHLVRWHGHIPRHAATDWNQT